MTTPYQTRTIPSTNCTGRVIPNTSHSVRDSIMYSDSVAPIITSFWNDLENWIESGKYWHDKGNMGTQYTTRIIP